ncbi:MAG: hypothetical protein A3J84_02875, partial [Ignavibacteria bacterium RIFOXYA2_FULL_37_17]
MKAAVILETCLYGNDLEALEHFYIDVIGLKSIAKAPGRNVVMQCGNGALILFNGKATCQPGGKFPAHGTEGAGHIAFVIKQEELEIWRTHLADKKIEIEKEVTWEEGGVSIYFRDPAGNSVELSPPTIWDGLGGRLIESL